MFHFTPPLTPDQHAIVVDSKQVIYDGFRQARVAKPSAGILVDEEFGGRILRDAIETGYVTALSTEKSGSDEFEFDKKDDTAPSKCAHPSCRCLLPANRPHGDHCSDYCKDVGDLTELHCGCEHVDCR